MSRASAATAPEIDLWRSQTKMTRAVVAANLDGITHQHSLDQPEPGGNRLNWVFGHLLWAYNNVLPMLGQQQVLDPARLERYARGQRPLEDPADAIDFQELLAAWQSAVGRVDEGLSRIDPEILDRPVPGSPSGNPNETVRSLLTTMMFHQAYHAGQTAVLRRIAGKEGAIR